MKICGYIILLLLLSFLSLLHVSITFRGHLQGGIFKKDIRQRQPNQCKILNFDIFLTVHLNIIFVTDQINVQILRMFIGPCIIVIVEEL